MKEQYDWLINILKAHLTTLKSDLYWDRYRKEHPETNFIQIPNNIDEDDLQPEYGLKKKILEDSIEFLEVERSKYILEKYKKKINGNSYEET